MTLLTKSLPILLVFSAFIFLNAEMWQVANDFTLPFFGMVAALLVAVGTLFVTVSVRRLAVDLARFASWSDVRPRCAGTPVEPLVPDDLAAPPDSPPLSRRARFNVSLLLFVAQSIQIILVALIVTLFYVLFGVFTVREATLLNWTTLSELTWAESWAVRIPLWGEDLLFTRPLVLVSTFISLFSGLQFAVSVVLDAGHRSLLTVDSTLTTSSLGVSSTTPSTRTCGRCNRTAITSEAIGALLDRDLSITDSSRASTPTQGPSTTPAPHKIAKARLSSAGSDQGVATGTA